MLAGCEVLSSVAMSARARHPEPRSHTAARGREARGARGCRAAHPLDFRVAVEEYLSRRAPSEPEIRCSRPSSGCATQQPRSHPRASSWRLRLRRRRPTTLHAPTTRPMWQAVGRWGQARQRGGPRQRRTAARERWVSVVRRVARVKRRHSNARRGTRAHVPSAYRRRCG